MKAHEFEAIFRRRSLRSPTQTDSRNDGYGILIRLWCLRMLVSLGAGLRLADPDQLADLDAQVRGLLGLLGLGALTAGIWMVSRPWALIVAGALLLWMFLPPRPPFIERSSAHDRRPVA